MINENSTRAEKALTDPIVPQVVSARVADENARLSRDIGMTPGPLKCSRPAIRNSMLTASGLERREKYAAFWSGNCFKICVCQTLSLWFDGDGTGSKGWAWHHRSIAYCIFPAARINCSSGVALKCGRISFSDVHCNRGSVAVPGRTKRKWYKHEADEGQTHAC